ncbi:MAG: cyclic nucleotide-binding domain-containing protein [Candidatus Accumulibacter sp.]|jgi:SulP family sulfate permease|nr:cyclic nucleotide-binding domain-containing protein [Accumulibacter sp.]
MKEKNMRELSGAWMRHSGDVWGGFAAMLVALPASVAFGVTVYAAIAPHYAAFGALAGVLGAMALGLIAPTFGGTDRLISAPCAPAAAVLSAFAIELAHQGIDPASIVLMLTVLGILTGVIQILIGFLGAGRLIRYIPYPVVSGFLSGVGLIIIGGQLPKLVGAGDDDRWYQVLFSPERWDWRGLTIGGVTIVAMVLSGRLVKKVPAVIVGIVCGALTYACIAVVDPVLLQLENNPLVIGSLGPTGAGYIAILTDRWNQIGELTLAQVAGLFSSALTLAVLLCIDTLKTCIVLDRMTRTRHDSGRELAAQGLANIAASAIGGMPGAGTMGPTMVNYSSGSQTRISGIVEGLSTVAAALALGSFVAWIPVATLSGVLIVVGLRMIDTDPMRFLESKSTIVDFCVVLAVIGCALTIGLIAAAAVGVILSIMLFLREQVGGTVVRRKSFVGERSSAWYRPEKEMRILDKKGRSAVIFELQGSLFFGTAHHLYRTLEPELATTEYLILDYQRVLSVDVTATHMLNQVRDVLAERNVPLLFSNVRERLPNGRNLREFLEFAGLRSDEETVHYLPTLEAAIEWVEASLLGEHLDAESHDRPPLELHEIELFKGSKPDTLVDLEASLEKRSWKAGETIFSTGDLGSDLFLIRKGEVKIIGSIGRGGAIRHIATYGCGDFLGGQAFLDNRTRGNDAIATRDCDMYVLSLEKFNYLADQHKRIALVLMTKLALLLSIRLRHTNEELTLLQDN